MVRGMARVTNRVDWSTLRDLVAAPPRATLAWEREDGLGLAPVRYPCAAGRHRVALDYAQSSPALLEFTPEAADRVAVPAA